MTYVFFKQEAIKLEISQDFSYPDFDLPIYYGVHSKAGYWGCCSFSNRC